VTENAGEVLNDHLGALAHAGEKRPQVLAGNSVHPAEPCTQFTPGDRGGCDEIDPLQRSPHFLRLHGGQIALEQPLVVRRLFGRMIGWIF